MRLIFFTVCGFLLGYLWTRLHFGRALNEADVEALNQAVGKVNDWEVQEKIDHKAWSTVQHHLNPGMEDISPILDNGVPEIT